MPKFNVTLSASAAISVVVTVEAEDEDAANAAAMLLEPQAKLAVECLLDVSDQALAGWQSQSAFGGTAAITHIGCELDESGFEAVDAWKD